MMTKTNLINNFAKFLCKSKFLFGIFLIQSGIVLGGAHLHAKPLVDNSFSNLWRQRQVVTGKVIDKVLGQPVPGVNVSVKGDTKRVTVTDANGDYSIQANSGETLLFTFVGMKSREITVGDNFSINVALEEEVSELESVVITGFQEIKKTLFTGASQSTQMEDIKLAGVADAQRMLEGRLAGVNVQNVTGSFGSAPRITIRGASSILGDTKPLWVVDGAIQEPIVDIGLSDLVSGNTNTLLSSAIAGLNPSDIKSFDVLKDASATALYGARALNGVIVITTKNGLRNQPTQVAYSGQFTMRPVPSYANQNFLNSQETVGIYRELEQKGFLSYPSSLQGRNGGIYNKMYNEINTFDPIAGTFKLENTPEAREQFLKQYEFANTNWFKTLFKPTPTQLHTISVTGGGKNSSQYASISYYNDPGWTIADKVNSITANLRSTFYVKDKLSVTLTLVGSNKNQRAPGAFSSESSSFYGGAPSRNFDINPFSYVTNASRALRPYDNNGNLEYYRSNWAPFNIINEISSNYADLRVLDLKLQGNIEYKITNTLKYTMLSTVDMP